MSSKNTKIYGEAYREIKNKVKAFAKSDLPVLFYGETGTGKELFAKYYMKHCNKEKRSGKRKTVNCATLSGELLSSEIFGHVRGAFTGAHEKRNGLLKACDKGILFLDELGKSSSQFQAAILRVAEGNSFRPVGSDEEETVDTRIIAATTNLSTIQEELKYRFSIVQVPPLQKEDIPDIVQARFNKPLGKTHLQELMGRDYTGNVRELLKIVDHLHVKQGESIFAKQSKGKSKPPSCFDHDRFEKEVDIWETHIQPLLDKHKFTDIKYKYLPWEPEWMGGKNRRFDLMLLADRLFHEGQLNQHGQIKDPMYQHSTLDLIEWMKMGIEEFNVLPPLIRERAETRLMPKSCESWERNQGGFLESTDAGILDPESLEGGESDQCGEKVYTKMTLIESIEPRISPADLPFIFKLHMFKHLETGLLPLLMDRIYRQYDPNQAPLDTVAQKPLLFNLFEFTQDEAEEEFRYIYSTFQLQKYGNDFKKAAKASGLSVSAFRGRLSRSKKKKH